MLPRLLVVMAHDLLIMSTHKIFLTKRTIYINAPTKRPKPKIKLYHLTVDKLFTEASDFLEPKLEVVTEFESSEAVEIAVEE